MCVVNMTFPFSFEMHIQTILALFLVSSTVAAPVFCPQDALVDAKLRDERFVNDIVQCLVGQAPCKGQLAQNIRSKWIIYGITSVQVVTIAPFQG